MNIALLGGAFNPPHNGHIMTARLAIEQGGVEQAWLMPCYSHPYSKKLESSEHRFEMCRLAAAREKDILVSRFEIDNELMGGTYEMLNVLRSAYPQHNFSFVIGTDNADTIHKWRNFEALISENRFIVIPRKGHKSDSSVTWYKNPPHTFLQNSTTLDISSTNIRAILGLGEYAGIISNLVDKSVLDYIKSNGLYGVKK